MYYSAFAHNTVGCNQLYILYLGLKYALTFVYEQYGILKYFYFKLSSNDGRPWGFLHKSAKTMTLGMVPTPDMKLQQEPMGAHFLLPNNTEKKILVRKTFITLTYQQGKGTEILVVTHRAQSGSKQTRANLAVTRLSKITRETRSYTCTALSAGV